VDHGGAVRASDRGWGVVVGAADNESESRRRSSEQRWPEQGKLSGKAMSNARACAREAKGRAQGLEEDVIVRKQELASRRRAWRSRRRSGRSSATWVSQGRASTGSRGRRHSRGVMRGTSEGRRWHRRCCDGERR
jgi:hypothetical protein